MKQNKIRKDAFLTMLNLHREHMKDINALYTLNVDIANSTLAENFFSLFDCSLECFFDKETCDAIVDYLCSHSKYTKEHPYIKETKTSKPLVWDDETLCTFLKLK